jgi:hypothetical protein
MAVQRFRPQGISILRNLMSGHNLDSSLRMPLSSQGPCESALSNSELSKALKGWIFFTVEDTVEISTPAEIPSLSCKRTTCGVMAVADRGGERRRTVSGCLLIADEVIVELDRMTEG